MQNVRISEIVFIDAGVFAGYSVEEESAGTEGLLVVAWGFLC